MTRIKKMGQLKPGDIVMIHGYDHDEFDENDPDGYWSDIGMVVQKRKLDLNQEYIERFAKEDDFYGWDVRLNNTRENARRWITLVKSMDGYTVEGAVTLVSRYQKLKDEPGEELMTDWLVQAQSECPEQTSEEIQICTDEDVLCFDKEPNA